MSQISSVIIGSTPSGGPVLTLTGDTGGAVGPTGGGTINIIGSPSSNINVEGNAGTHTLVIDIITQKIGEITTSDNTPTSIPDVNVTLIPGSGVYIAVQCIGVIDDYSEVVLCNAVIAALKPLVGPTTLQRPTISYVRNKNFNAAAIFTLSGDTVQFNVIGLPATNMKWTAIRNTIFV